MRQSCAHLLLSFINAPVLNSTLVHLTHSEVHVRALLSALHASRYSSVTEVKLLGLPPNVVPGIGTLGASHLCGFGLPAGVQVEVQGYFPHALACVAGGMWDGCGESISSLSIVLEHGYAHPEHSNNTLNRSFDVKKLGVKAVDGTCAYDPLRSQLSRKWISKRFHNLILANAVLELYIPDVCPTLV